MEHFNNISSPVHFWPDHAPPSPVATCYLNVYSLCDLPTVPGAQKSTGSIQIRRQFYITYKGFFVSREGFIDQF